MPRTRQCYLASVLVDMTAEDRREMAVPADIEECGQFRQDLAGWVALGCIGADGIVQRGHHDRGLDSPAGDVADHEDEASVGGGDHIEPIAPDLHHVQAGLVPRGDLHSGDLRDDPRKERTLQRFGKALLLAVETFVLLGQELGRLAATDQSLGHHRRTDGQAPHRRG